MLFLTTLPVWASAALLVGLTTVLAMLGPVVVRRHVSLSRLSTNNEVAGFKFATVGVLYAVMVAFAMIVVWGKFDEAELAVAQEAGASATIYALARGAGAELGPALEAEVNKYINSVVEQDWPMMARAVGTNSRASVQALGGLYATTLAFNPVTRRDSAIQNELLRQLDIITAARRVRSVISAGIMPNVVWWVLFGGAVVTICFTFFFGTENLRAQTMMTGMLAALMFSALLVIIVIDYPFSGPVRVSPHALEQVLDEWSAQARMVPG